MRDHVRDLATRAKAVRVTDFHQTPLAGEVEGRDYDRAGIITDEWLVANTPVADGDYYICRPRPFLRHAVSTLSLAGAPSTTEERPVGKEGSDTCSFWWSPHT